MLSLLGEEAESRGGGNTVEEKKKKLFSNNNSINALFLHLKGRDGWLRPPPLAAMMLSVYSVYGARDLISAGVEDTVSSLKKPSVFWIRTM
ncbi:hypothetical protein EYF80_041555 [Liparis tanakae]|uniref:Uncharacterized protein n=1 Tax=Liparis tanakae TaxID=230148 RepID=A0A4Z2G4R8_9TELE|nr:hypothetical protein EYF80_041555 [Liparis tanakae]